MTETLTEPEFETVIERLDKDTKRAAERITEREARYLVDLYYQTQNYRLRTDGQVRALSASSEPHSAIAWLSKQNSTLETRIKSLLDVYSASKPIGQWARSIVGIGPVLAAGLMAHIDITQCCCEGYRDAEEPPAHDCPGLTTAGKIWRFAGLDPTEEWLGTEKARKLVADAAVVPLSELVQFLDNATIVPVAAMNEVARLDKEAGSGGLSMPRIRWIAKQANRNPGRLYAQAFDKEKGKLFKSGVIASLARRPWNASLKVVCWKIGESFVKVQANPKDIYGKVYAARKALEMQRNEAGQFSEQAKRALNTKNYGKDTKAREFYEKGQLPPAHIHARSTRYAVKLYLSHWHHKAYEAHFGKAPPFPYPIAILGHADYIPPPN